MKLTAKAIEAIDNQKTKLLLALALGFKEQWIDKVVKKNKDNGPLTTAQALQTIRFETGAKDHEILEEVPEKNANVNQQEGVSYTQ